MKKSESKQTKSRKEAHIDICLNENVKAGHNYWDDVHLIHNAIPEINKGEVDLSVKLFGRKLKAPIVISAMTGGCAAGEKINRNLAEAAAEAGVGLGVGSQRAGLSDKALARTYSVVKDYDVPLVIGNIGAPQLVPQRGKKPLNANDAAAALEMIGGHILAVHLNFAQEVVQPEGDHSARDCLDAIKALGRNVPILVKETGCGISREAALSIKKAGARGIDVGGLGGTSFPAVEYYRAKEAGEPLLEKMGHAFWNWGIPTPASIVYSQVGLPIIGTGGVRNGIDALKSIVVGADASGIAGALLPASTKSADAVLSELNAMIEAMKSGMFLLGCKNTKEAQKLDFIAAGELRGWLSGRQDWRAGYD